MPKYIVNTETVFNCGFSLDSDKIVESVIETNRTLARFPKILYTSIDFKATSGVVGAVFANSVAQLTDGVVNPIEKGHPDIIPASGEGASERELRNYPEGLEVKCTVGNVKLGSTLRSGDSRIEKLVGLTWQAHHREVKKLLGLVWDFVKDDENEDLTPHITGVFYSSSLAEDDWGVISGTTGRNTKVTGMRTSGKQKMGNGWVCLIDDSAFISRYASLLGVRDLFPVPEQKVAKSVSQISEL